VDRNCGTFDRKLVRKKERQELKESKGRDILCVCEMKKGRRDPWRERE